MRAYVINLDQATQRWARMERLGAEAGIAWTRFSAVDKNDPGIAEHLRNLPPGFKGTRLGPGAAACFESHRRVWAQIARTTEPYATVFEDDVVVSASLANMLCRTSWIPPDADIVRLETRLIRATTERHSPHQCDGRRVVRLLSTQLGTAAYIISSSAAGKLLTFSENFIDPVDEFIFNSSSPYFSALTIYQMVPGPCVQAHLLGFDQMEPGLRTQIGPNQRVEETGKKPVPYRVAREMIRPARQLFDFFRGRERGRILFE